MSINQPKPRQIKLPFSVPKPGRTQAGAPARVCGICRQRDSKYTCPRCNVGYCSLDCFQSQAHMQCSEPFYKSTALSEIASDPKADFEEKRKMLEMLRRFEDAQADGPDIAEGLDVDDDEGGDEWDTLLEKLADVDLDDMKSNDLFHLLPQNDRETFLSALRNPGSDETRILLDLAVAEGEGDEADRPQTPSALPWWEGDDLGDVDVDEDSEDGEKRNVVDVASPPEGIPDEVVLAISPPEGAGKKLLYNAIAICLAYIHTLLANRLPSMAPQYITEQDIDAIEIKDYIGRLVPYLVDQKSTIRYETLRNAWENVWERIGQEASTNLPQSTLHQLLSTLKLFLHPPIITSERPKLLQVLADLYHLFSPLKGGSAVSKKLAFYARALGQLDRADWLEIERLVQKELEQLDLNDDADADLAEGEKTDREALRIL